MGSVPKWGTVVSDQPLDLAPGDRVLVLGCLREDYRVEPELAGMADGTAAAVLAGRVVKF